MKKPTHINVSCTFPTRLTKSCPIREVFIFTNGSLLYFAQVILRDGSCRVYRVDPAKVKCQDDKFFQFEDLPKTVTDFVYFHQTGLKVTPSSDGKSFMYYYR